MLRRAAFGITLLLLLIIQTSSTFLTFTTKAAFAPTAMELPWFEVVPSSVTLGPDPSIGEEFSVGVKITGPPPLGLDESWNLVGIEFHLLYDAALLEFVNVTEGPFLKDPTWNWYGTWFTGYTANDPPLGSRVTVGNLIFPNGTGIWDQTTFPNGEGVVANVTFKAIKQDFLNHLECNLTLSSISGVWAVDKDGYNIQINEAKNVNGFYRMYPEYHNIGISYVSKTKNVVGQGHCINITFYLESWSYCTEEVNVTVYADETLAFSQNFTVLSGTGSVRKLTWTVSSEFAKGNYSIKVVAQPVTNEVILDDNNASDGWIFVAMLGDLTHSNPSPWDFVPDGMVDGSDGIVVSRCFGSSPTTPPPMRWEPNCDITNDNFVDGSDLIIVSRHYGEKDP